MPFNTGAVALSTIILSGFTSGAEVQLFKPSTTVILSRKGGEISEILAQVGDVLESGDALILVRRYGINSVITAPNQGELKHYGPNVKVDESLEAGDFVAVLQTKYVDGIISLGTNSPISDPLSPGSYCCIVANGKSFSVRVNDVTKHGNRYLLYFSSQDQLSELMVLLESTKSEKLEISFQLKQQ